MPYDFFDASYRTEPYRREDDPGSNTVTCKMHVS